MDLYTVTIELMMMMMIIIIDLFHYHPIPQYLCILLHIQESQYKQEEEAIRVILLELNSYFYFKTMLKILVYFVLIIYLD